MRNILAVASVAAVFAIAPLGKGADVAASASARQASTSAAQHEHAQTPAASDVHDMSKMHQQMMSEMQAADAKLDQLVSQMTAASGDAKVNATAAVVAEVVRQQKAMHEHMGRMHEEMMGAMMKKH